MLTTNLNDFLLKVKLLTPDVDRFNISSCSQAFCPLSQQVEYFKDF